MHKYIVHKANRNLIYSSGQIGILPTFITKTNVSGNSENSIFLFINNSLGTTICYYSLLEVIFPPVEGSEESTRQEYIICLICDVVSDEGFALYPQPSFIHFITDFSSFHIRFRNDLVTYCENLQRLLTDVKINNKSSETLKDHLSSWYIYTVKEIPEIPLSYSFLPF